MKTRSVKSTKTFYDSLASDYDLMTSFRDRFAKEEAFFRFLVKKYHIRSAIDAGCGTGFHSLLLSKLGVKVMGVDISRKMLTAARKNSQEYHLPITTVQASFGEIATRTDTAADALFCMGNSLAHVLSEEDVLDGLSNFREVLRPKGLLVLQLVNFDRILKAKERIQNVRETGGKSFQRSYRYQKTSITFVISISSGRRKTLKKISVRLNPIRSKALRALIQRAGFAPVAEYGSIQREPFSAGKSRDLIILAKRAQL